MWTPATTVEPYLNDQETSVCDQLFVGVLVFFQGSMGDDKFKLGTSSYIAIASYQHPFPERVYHLAREALLSGGCLESLAFPTSETWEIQLWA